MGSDPRSSVLNADCRSHDVPNLYVVDGSVFPSASEKNQPHDDGWLRGPPIILPNVCGKEKCSMANRRESLKIIGAIGTTCAFPFSADELYGQHGPQPGRGREDSAASPI